MLHELLTPAVMTSIVAAMVAIISAIGRVAIIIIREIRATQSLVKTNAEAGAAAGEKRDAKLDRIQVLVNGRYGEVLQELAVLRTTVANLTGTISDRILAEAAQARAEAQAKMIAQALALKTQQDQDHEGGE